MKTKTVSYGFISIFILPASAISGGGREQRLCGRGLPHTLATKQLICLGDSYNHSYDPASFSPWTHAPFCIKGSSSQPWCVFTNADTSLPVAGKAPGDNHGISIITTPELASTSLNLLEYLPSHPRETKQTTADWQKLYKVTPIPGKGLGAIATEKIPKGRIVLTDRAMILSAAEYPDDVTREQVQILLNRAVEQLPDPEMVHNLSRKGRPEDGDFSEVEDLLLSNSFLVEVRRETLIGLFGDLSRFNHDCRPNAIAHFSEKTLAMTIVASRDIGPEEELTISYIDPTLAYAERQSTLHQIWGFTCTCSLCSLPLPERKASDKRRAEIQRLNDIVIQQAQSGNFRQAIKPSENLIRLIRDEGLVESMKETMYDIPATLYFHVGHLEKAREYTLLSLEAILGDGLPVDEGSKEEEKVRTLRAHLERIEWGIEIKAKNKRDRRV
ncbi:hypothetical protein V8F20_009074 [Naviculisporaceae sp. PSN 640]